MYIANYRKFFLMTVLLILSFFFFCAVHIVSGAEINSAVLKCDSTILDDNTSLSSITKNDVVDLVISLNQAGANLNDIVYWIDNDILTLSYDLDSDMQNNTTSIILHIKGERPGLSTITISSASDYYANTEEHKVYKYAFSVSEYKQIDTFSGSIYQNNMPTSGTGLNINISNYEQGKIVVSAQPVGLSIRDFHFEYDSSTIQIGYEINYNNENNTTLLTIQIIPLHEGSSKLKISSSFDENSMLSVKKELLFLINVINVSYKAVVPITSATPWTIIESTATPTPTFDPRPAYPYPCMSETEIFNTKIGKPSEIKKSFHFDKMEPYRRTKTYYWYDKSKYHSLQGADVYFQLDVHYYDSATKTEYKDGHGYVFSTFHRLNSKYFQHYYCDPRFD